MTIRYSRRALSQLASAHEYLRDRSDSAADNVTESIRRTIERLKQMPQLGRATDENGVYVIVEPEYWYRVFYRVEGREVFVIRVMHGRQG